MYVAVAAASVNKTTALNGHDLLLLQEGTVEDTMDTDEVIRVLTAMLGSDRASAPRDMSIATWMDMTIGRGDDARLVYLPDLPQPQQKLGQSMLQCRRAVVQFTLCVMPPTSSHSYIMSEKSYVLHVRFILLLLHLQLIARLGRWLRTALNTSYLRFVKPKGLLAAGGWDKDRPDAFFDERFCLEVEDDLVLLVYPWLADLRKQLCTAQHAEPQLWAMLAAALCKTIASAQICGWRR